MHGINKVEMVDPVDDLKSSQSWDLAKNVHKLNDKDKTTFLSPSEVWSLPAPSSTRPFERELVVNSETPPR